MYRYMMKKKVRCLLFAVLLALSGGGGSLFALILSALVDSAGKSTEELAKVFTGGLAYVACYISVSIFYSLVKNRILADARYCLKDDIFKGIMDRTMAGFCAGNRGEYMNELTENINLFEGMYFQNIIHMLECVFFGGAAAAVCIMTQPFMLLLMAGLGFVTLAITRLTTGPLERSTERLAGSTGRYMEELKDDFGGFRLIYSFGIVPCILKKHEAKNLEMEQAKRRKGDCAMICSYAGQLTGLLSTVLVMAAAAYFALKGVFSVGMVIAFGHLIGNIVSTITAMPSIIANFRAARPLRLRFQELIRQREEEGTESLGELEEGIRLDDLSFGYEEGREVLRHLSFRFLPGRHYAVTGRSGSGKSTLLSLLLGYYHNYKGNIYFDGRELRQLKKNEIGTVMAEVSQETFLFHDTIRNNLTLYNEDYSAAEIEYAVEQAGLKELLESLPEGLSTVIGENGDNFSGGERQRFSLARALLRKSRVLLLDEFTASLDERTAREVEERVLALEGRLIITITHRMDPEILRQYDRVLTLEQGSITVKSSNG